MQMVLKKQYQSPIINAFILQDHDIMVVSLGLGIIGNEDIFGLGGFEQ